MKIWKYLRKLVRAKRETIAIRYLQDQRTLDELRFAKVMERAQKEIDQLKEELAKKTNEIKSLHELDIPVLERKLEVEQQYSTYLAMLHERELVKVEADIAVANTRIADQASIRQTINSNRE